MAFIPFSHACFGAFFAMTSSVKVTWGSLMTSFFCAQCAGHSRVPYVLLVQFGNEQDI